MENSAVHIFSLGLLNHGKNKLEVFKMPLLGVGEMFYTDEPETVMLFFVLQGCLCNVFHN